jgi:hypothetical protein
MIEAAHLTDDQFARFRSRTLEPEELLAVDFHLAECAACRERLQREMGAAEQISGLRSQFSEHLTYEQTIASAEGRVEDAVERHLLECAACRAEVEDLRQLRIERRPEPRRSSERMLIRRAWMAIAAGLLLAAGLAFWSMRQQKPLQIAEVKPLASSAEMLLAPEQQAAMQEALATHRLPRAAVLDRVIAKRGVLLGANDRDKSFALLAPVGTAVLNDRPVFRWEAVGSAATYTVAVFDERFRKVAESPAIAATQWSPEQPLERGRIYAWQVTAHSGGQTLRAPVPPAPEARFEVAAAAAALEVEQARRDHPGNHLLLAVLLAKAGALDEARTELDALAARDPFMAKELSRSLDEIRKP